MPPEGPPNPHSPSHPDKEYLERNWLVSDVHSVWEHLTTKGFKFEKEELTGFRFVIGLGTSFSALHYGVKLSLKKKKSLNQLPLTRVGRAYGLRGNTLPSNSCTPPPHTHQIHPRDRLRGGIKSSLLRLMIINMKAQRVTSSHFIQKGT